MSLLKARAKTEEARESAGHSKNQWKQFMNITRQEAERLLGDYKTWNDLEDEMQGQVLNTVNSYLKTKKAPEVKLFLLDWRMPRAMGEARKGEGKETETMSRSYWDPARET